MFVRYNKPPNKLDFDYDHIKYDGFEIYFHILRFSCRLLKSGHSVAICVLFACPPHVNHIIKLEKYTIRFIKRRKYLQESGKILK